MTSMILWDVVYSDIPASSFLHGEIEGKWIPVRSNFPFLLAHVGTGLRDLKATVSSPYEPSTQIPRSSLCLA